MTMPSEKLNSLINARRFLLFLLDPKKSPRVPKSVRREAYHALKHYPAEYEIEKLEKLAPELFKDPYFYGENK